jgi:hypothetical protein
MATERQIAANRQNASRSTGPISAEGKARSRANATRHGMAGASSLVEAAASAAFEDRRAKWGDEYQPVGESAGWALDRAVAASLRIELCERAVDEVATGARQRAMLAWDQDQAVAAAMIASRLGRDPVLASRQLQTTRAGAELMVEAWFGLVARLETGEDWSESEASKALDLLGVATDLRSGRTMIDAEPGADCLGFRRSLAFEEVDRLETLVEEALGPLDVVDRRVAMGGNSALLSQPSRLVLRYERDAWRRYRESIRQVRDSALSAVVDETPSPATSPSLSPVGPRRPEVRERALAEFSGSFEEERRALLAEALPIRLGVTDRLDLMGLDDESAWLEELERRVEAGPEGLGGSGSSGEGVRSSDAEVDLRATRLLATERTRFGG